MKVVWKISSPGEMEVRNPNPEIRKKPEGRNPNDEHENTEGTEKKMIFPKRNPGDLRPTPGQNEQLSPITHSFGFSSSDFGFRPSPHSGVALVITLIMLSVITFM